MSLSSRRSFPFLPKEPHPTDSPLRANPSLRVSSLGRCLQHTLLQRPGAMVPSSFDRSGLFGFGTKDVSVALLGWCLPILWKLKVEFHGISAGMVEISTHCDNYEVYSPFLGTTWCIAFCSSSFENLAKMKAARLKKPVSHPKSWG